MEIEPIVPETAFKLHIAEKETSITDVTVASHESRLGFLLRWCEKREIENQIELTGRTLQEFRLWRRNIGDLTKVSERAQMDKLRVFVKWLEPIDAVEQDLHKKVRSPDITPRENSRDVILETDDADAMLAYLERYEYASIRHVTATLLWHTMLRMGSVGALDVEDYDPEEQSLRLRHRSETDTPPKNKREGERIVAVSDEVSRFLDDWNREQRREFTDGHGRNPFLSLAYGRIGGATIRTTATR